MMKGSTGMSKGLVDRINRLSSNARQHVRRRLLIAYLALPERGRGHATYPPTRLGAAPGSTPPT